MKKLSRILIPALVVTATAALSACGGSVKAAVYEKGTAVKIGLITLHDEQSTYDKNFIDSMKAAQKALGNKVSEVIIKSGVKEDEGCFKAAKDLVKQGCNFIFADSFGHESFILDAAKKWPEVQFGHATGTQAKVAGVANHHNAFASIYEGRFLAGYAAGLKLADMELKTENKDENGNIKLGYVGAFPYAEVVSGYTSWFLGVRAGLKSMTPTADVSMEVTYTSSWYDPVAEAAGANKLIQRGAAIISQHADSMGAPGACEEAGVPDVTYNVPTATECPKTYLAYSKIDWAPYFVNFVESMYNGTKLAGEVNNNWTGTMATGSVVYDVKDAGYKAKCEAVKAELVAGTRKVFDCATFTVNGEHLTTAKADVDDFGDFVPETEAIKTEGEVTYYNESADRSAPYFDLRIDGIKELADK